MNAERKAKTDTYTSDVVGATIVRWYLPQNYSCALQITVPAHSNPQHYKEIRFCEVHSVELDGQTISWDECLEWLFLKQAFAMPLTHTFSNTIGKITSASFDDRSFLGFGETHLDCSGHVSMRLMIDPVREHTLTIHALGDHTFIKLM